MEIPSTLKDIYRHWSCHTTVLSDSRRAETDMFKDNQLFSDITWFINQRMDIWKKKTSGDFPPYTTDLILSTYRFCNIFREFDRQTIEFHTLLNPLREDLPLWLLNMFYCRMVARSETIRHVGLLSYDKHNNQQVYKKLLAYPRPRFGTPYVFPISTILKSDTPTREQFITEYLPQVMEDIVKEISSWKRMSVYDGVQRILPLFKYNLNFLWTEVLIDVAYQFPEYTNLFDRFPIGPGSAPTFKRINSDIDPSILVTQLSLIYIDTGITCEEKPLILSAENWEGIGCEFRKYTNLKSGKGRKRVYKRTIS